MVKRFTGGRFNLVEAAVDSFGNALGQGIVDQMQISSDVHRLKEALDAVGVKYNVDEAGNLRSDTNRKTLEYAQSLVKSGASVEQLKEILSTPSIQSGLAKLDFGTSGRTDEEVVRAANHFIQGCSEAVRSAALDISTDVDPDVA